jgi:hypothetical protein
VTIDPGPVAEWLHLVNFLVAMAVLQFFRKVTMKHSGGAGHHSGILIFNSSGEKVLCTVFTSFI